MAGRRGGAGSLVAGLLTIAAVVAAPSSVSVAEPTVVATVTPNSERSGPAAQEPLDERGEATRRTQRCFAELGYYKGPIDGKVNPDTWTAHWFFKNEHGLKRYADFLNDQVQAKLAKVCKSWNETVAAEPAEAEPAEAETAPPEPSPQEQTEAETAQPEPSPQEPAEAESAQSEASQPETARQTEPVPRPERAPQPEPTSKSSASGDEEPASAPVELAEVDTTGAILPERTELEPIRLGDRLDIDCLPDELIAVLRKAHGDRVTARGCGRTCLPAPKGISQSQIDQMQSRDGIVWCRTCVAVDGRLTLEDVQRVEKAGNIELCPTPPHQLPRQSDSALGSIKPYTRTRALYRALPPVPEDPAAIAVIVGNRNYAKLPPRPASRNDAGAMYAFLTEHLGYRQDNIIDVRDARKADLERLFGAGPGMEGDLARMARSQPKAKVLVYYSGHGTTDIDQKENYLLPIDAERYREELSGYPLSTLYANLAKLEAGSVLLLLETEFGRDHSAFVLPPNLPENKTTALPRSPLPMVTVIAASDRGQRTLVDTTYDVGLFTRYLIQGLSGSADLRPVGDGNGRLDSAEIYVYTAAMVQLAARKSLGLLQNPVYSSATTSVLAGAGPVAAKPN